MYKPGFTVQSFVDFKKTLQRTLNEEHTIAHTVLKWVFNILEYVTSGSVAFYIYKNTFKIAFGFPKKFFSRIIINWLKDLIFRGMQRTAPDYEPDYDTIENFGDIFGFSEEIELDEMSPPTRKIIQQMVDDLVHEISPGDFPLSAPNSRRQIRSLLPSMYDVPFVVNLEEGKQGKLEFIRLVFSCRQDQIPASLILSAGKIQKIKNQDVPRW